MKKIAITGNIASGKTLLEDTLKEFGYKVLDTDVYCHELMVYDENVKNAVWELFSTLDRGQIGNVVFKDPEFKQRLEQILHPLVRKGIEEFFEANKDAEFVFVSVPLLYEANMQNMFDKVVLVSADEKIRLERLIRDRKYTLEHALERMGAQMEENKKPADYIIKNEGSRDDMKVKALELTAALRLL